MGNARFIVERIKVSIDDKIDTAVLLRVLEHGEARLHLQSSLPPTLLANRKDWADPVA